MSERVSLAVGSHRPRSCGNVSGRPHECAAEYGSYIDDLSLLPRVDPRFANERYQLNDVKLGNTSPDAFEPRSAEQCRLHERLSAQIQVPHKLAHSGTLQESVT